MHLQDTLDKLQRELDKETLKVHNLEVELSVYKNIDPTVRRQLHFHDDTVISPFQSPNSRRTPSPINRRTNGLQGSSNQQSGNQATGTKTVGNQTTASDIATPLAQKFGELFSREEKKSITIYKGKSTDKLVTDWLKSTERVARNNSWDDS